MPAVFCQDPEKPGVAKLIAINQQKRTFRESHSIEIAKGDLAAAIKIIQPIASLLHGVKGPVTAALYQRCYICPGL